MLAARPQPAGYGDDVRVMQRSPQLPPGHHRADPRCGCGITHRVERASGHGSHEGASYNEHRSENHGAHAAPRGAQGVKAYERPVLAHMLVTESVAGSTSG